MSRPTKPTKAAIAAGYRSGLELENANRLDSLGVSYRYEEVKLPYTKPATEHVYTPDFVIDRPDGSLLFVETKGRFTLEDQKKHKLIKEQHPDLDLRFVFSNPRGTHKKGVKRRYCDWCDRLGIPWAKKVIPLEWLS